MSNELDRAKEETQREDEEEEEEIPRFHDVMKRDTPLYGNEDRAQRFDLLARSDLFNLGNCVRVILGCFN